MKQACRFEWEKRYHIEEWKITATLWKRSSTKSVWSQNRKPHLWSRRILWGANRTVAEIELESEGETHETKLAWNRGDKWQSVLQFKLKQQSIYWC
jgi:hypothetical protein